MKTSITLIRAKNFLKKWKRSGAKFDVAGGVWKGKQTVHDIDLVVKPRNVAKVKKAIESNCPGIPVELYVPSSNYSGMKNALRSSTYENISNKLMSGLKFRKVVIK